ncbi:MAG: phosphonate utilization protein, partial [Acidimicrobiales bacterium]|nr:phosphonate utilization protein [Acidimicrobiales bacterium]
MLTATLLALSAAALHAVWNLLLKTTSVGDRGVASWGQFLFGALLALPALAVVGLPGTVAVPWLLGSAAIHVAYVLALVRAYGAGDFSLAYPLARGTGAMVAAIAGVLVLGDHLPPAAWGAIAVVVAGLVSLVGRTASPASVRWALLTALAIGAYTTVDAHGSRISADGAAYGLAL